MTEPHVSTVRIPNTVRDGRADRRAQRPLVHADLACAAVPADAHGALEQAARCDQVDDMP
jgi:hypothetical protein